MDEVWMKEQIRKAKKGDAQAFGRLYAENAAGLYRFALYYLHDPHDAEDAVQDAAVTAYRNVRSLRKDDAFRSWFFKILSNECKKHLIKNAARPEELSEQVPDLAADLYPDALQPIEMQELLDTLPERDREIVILAVLEGYKSNEIAKITGMKAATVRSRLSRALQKLKEETLSREVH